MNLDLSRHRPCGGYADTRTCSECDLPWDECECTCPECDRAKERCTCGTVGADDYDEFAEWEKEHCEPEPETFEETDE